MIDLIAFKKFYSGLGFYFVDGWNYSKETSGGYKTKY